MLENMLQDKLDLKAKSLIRFGGVLCMYSLMEVRK